MGILYKFSRIAFLALQDGWPAISINALEYLNYGKFIFQLASFRAVCLAPEIKTRKGPGLRSQCQEH